jgi:hypothetical protein
VDSVPCGGRTVENVERLYLVTLTVLTCCWRLYLPTFNLTDLQCYLQDEVVFGVDQVSYYVEDLLLEARTGGSDEDAEALTDDDIELLRGFEYKVRKKLFFAVFTVCCPLGLQIRFRDFFAIYGH